MNDLQAKTRPKFGPRFTVLTMLWGSVATSCLYSKLGSYMAMWLQLLRDQALNVSQPVATLAAASQKLASRPIRSVPRPAKIQSIGCNWL